MASNRSADNVNKYNFIAEPDGALQCVICLDVAEDPRQHEKCGRLLCKECLETEVWERQTMSQLQDGTATVF